MNQDEDETERRIRIKLEREIGPDIMHYLKQKDVQEIILNPDGTLWVEKAGKGLKKFGFMSEWQAFSMIGTVASSLKTCNGGEVINQESPVLECEFPIDGCRFEAVIPPITKGPAFSIRLQAKTVFYLTQYLERGIISAPQVLSIKQCIADHSNILVVGGTSSGKTTLANAIIAEISTQFPHERLILIEDTNEIQCVSENHLILHSTRKDSMQDLLRITLRMRPDRIIVGEVRGGEALALLKAWNTGHPGGVATLHANSAIEGLTRLESLLAEATNVPQHVQIAAAINIVIFITKDRNHPEGRMIKEILRITGYNGKTYQFQSLS